jgi:hypothetical protein
MPSGGTANGNSAAERVDSISPITAHHHHCMAAGSGCLDALNGVMKHHAILKQAKLLGAVSAKARATACSYDDIEYALSHSICWQPI